MPLEFSRFIRSHIECDSYTSYNRELIVPQVVAQNTWSDKRLETERARR